MTEPSSTTEAVSRWADLLPDGTRPRFAVGDAKSRTALIDGLRTIADFLESRPEVPVPLYGISICAFATGTAEQKRAQVDYAGLLLGVTPVDDTHYEAALNFGPVQYAFTAVWRDSTVPVFADGQEVRLTGQEADCERGRRSLAGVVTGSRDDTGTHYHVRFPGRPGTFVLKATDLEPAPPFAAVETSRGPVTALQAAEDALIDTAARIRARMQLGLSPDADDATDSRLLATAIGRTGQLPRHVLIRRLTSQIDAKADLYRRQWTPRTSASLAGLDHPHVPGTPPASRPARAAAPAERARGRVRR